MKIQAIALFVISFGCTALAQEDALNQLTVDRPGIADAPYTVGQGVLQIETGFDYFGRPGGDLYSLPTVMFRTGIGRQSELRVSARHILDKTTTQKLEGVSPLSIGIKAHVIHQQRWIPDIDILSDIIIPLGKSDLHPDELGHTLFLLFQNDFSEKTAVNYNTGFIWDGIVTDGTFTFSFCFNFMPTEKTGLFLEYYDFLREGTKEHGLDGGLTMLLSPRIQADLSGGISLINGHDWAHFASAGITFRID